MTKRAIGDARRLRREGRERVLRDVNEVNAGTISFDAAKSVENMPMIEATTSAIACVLLIWAIASLNVVRGEFRRGRQLTDRWSGLERGERGRRHTRAWAIYDVW